MILTNEAILKHKDKGDIIIEPFEPSLVSINSVDVRLGHKLWHLKRNIYRDVYNPKSNDWNEVKPQKVEDIRNTFPTFGKGVLSSDDKAFVLESGEFYLATTLEKIGTALPKGNDNAIVPEMKAKSTVGRQGLTVALCAGLGDVGYSSQWALEVRVTDDGAVPVAIGTPIAQVVFHFATPTNFEYNGETRYQNNGLVKFLPKPLKIIRS